MLDRNFLTEFELDAKDAIQAVIAPELEEFVRFLCGIRDDTDGDCTAIDSVFVNTGPDGSQIIEVDCLWDSFLELSDKDLEKISDNLELNADDVIKILEDDLTNNYFLGAKITSEFFTMPDDKRFLIRFKIEDPIRE